MISCKVFFAPAGSSKRQHEDLTTWRSNTFIGPTQYGDPDIVCHLNAKNAGVAVPVNGGDVLVAYWNEWPDSHKGPIIDMLANCNGPCVRRIPHSSRTSSQLTV